MRSRRSVITRSRYSRKCSGSTPSSEASVAVERGLRGLLLHPWQRDDVRVVRRDSRRPRDPAFVVVLLDDCSNRPPRADPVAPHHERSLAPVLVEVHRAKRLRVERPELEDVAELERGLRDEPAATHRTRIAGIRLSDVREARFVIAPRLDAAQMPAVAVRAGNELPVAQRLVRDDLDLDAHGTERSAARAERRTDLVVGCWPERRAENRRQLLLTQLVVAAFEDRVVRALVAVEALVQPGLVAVERVGVLHDELADAHQPTTRPRLVAFLRAEVVPGLRQLLVRLDLARVERHRLLVR